jgi:hypothetical protein
MAQPGQAQQSRYSSDWRQPSSPAQGQGIAGRSADLDRLLKELEALTKEAERARAADPRFLGDLKNLVRRYSWPWKSLVARDDFRDGDYARNPAWVVSSGAFSVSAEGLVTKVAADTRPVEPERTAEPRKQDSDDLARALLGGVLRELSRGREADDTSAPARAETVTEARIGLERRIPNQFALRVELQSRPSARGLLELGVGQGPAGLGYRLVYEAGASPGLSLVRKGTRGDAVIEAVSQRTVLEDGRSHVLLLTRDRTGGMTLAVDGKTRFRVTDRAFRAPFDRFIITNGGGDFIIRSVAIYGAP